MGLITSYNGLYIALGTLVTNSTGRQWWRKGGIQIRPRKPYATIFLAEDTAHEKQVVENVDIDGSGDDGETFIQVPWSTKILNVQIMFFGNMANGTAFESASRIGSALYLEERDRDLYQICALSGGVRTIDLSTWRMDDIDIRAEVRFNIAANVADPQVLTDDAIFDIDTQNVIVTHVKQDGTETSISVDIENDQN
jgi:hypothetical protein